MSKLTPTKCPLCGGEARSGLRAHEASPRPAGFVRCDACMLELLSFAEPRRAECAAIRKWNRREGL